MTAKVITVPNGHIADVITYLEMTERPETQSSGSSLTFSPWSLPSTDDYLTLFKAVGEPWLWLSRLLLSSEELQSTIHDDGIDLFRVQDGDKDVGFAELDFRVSGECEIGFFGLIPQFNGKGHGRWLMQEVLDRAWKPDVKRVWLHTCTLDSPYALGFYQKSGFRAYKREIGMNRDPRLDGLLPEKAGPHIPVIS